MTASKNEHLVSIGMPVFNGEAYIAKAIESILEQSYKNFELVISDNLSTDATQSICEDYQREDARVKYIRRDQNYGAANNFQYVFDITSSEYFMWAAIDDLWDSEFLALSLKVFESHQDVGLVFCDMCTLNLLNGDKLFSAIGHTSHNKKIHKYLFRLFNPCPSLIYGLHKRSVLNNIRIQNFDFSDVFITHWYEINSQIKTIPITLYTAGSKGVRVPFSITGQYIDATEYLSCELTLLRKNFGYIISSFLYLLNYYLIKKTQATLNRKIKNAEK